MAKTSRFKHQYRENASNGHKKIGDLLRTYPAFRNYPSYQEYHLYKINQELGKNVRGFVDWAVPHLRLAIEVQGEQHFKPVRFGGVSTSVAVSNFANQLEKDARKKHIILSSGWKLIELTSKEIENLTGDELYQKYLELLGDKNE